MLFAVMVVDPHAQPRPEAFDQRQRDLGKAAPAARAGKGDVEHHHATHQTARLRELAWRAKSEVLHERASLVAYLSHRKADLENLCGMLGSCVPALALGR